MRTLIALVLVLLGNQLFAQELVPWSGKDEISLAVRQEAKIEDLKRQLSACQEEVRRLTGELRILRGGGDPKPIAQKLAKIIGAPNCRACPVIKAWLKPHLLRKGYAVAEIDEPMQPGKIYPYVQVCNDGACSTIMLPNRDAQFTQTWFDSQLSGDVFIPAPAGD